MTIYESLLASEAKAWLCFGRGLNLPAGMCSMISIRAVVVVFEVVIVIEF